MKNKNNKNYKDKIRFGGNRIHALERDGYKCTMCEATNGLVVHHKDNSGSSVNPNNKLENLQTLCRSCHKKVHTVIHTTICKYCKKEFQVERHDLSYRKYCSKECTDKDKTGNVKSSYLTKCKICDKEFLTTPYKISVGKGKYCSKECSIISQQKRITMECEICRKEFETIPSKLRIGKGRFCSHKCRGHFGRMIQLQERS